MNIHLTWPDSADVDAGANSVNHASRWLLLIKAAKVITTDKGPPRKKTRPSCRKTLGSEMEDLKDVTSLESMVKTELVKSS